MSRRRRYQEDHKDETWLLPYADLLTLLLALFIVMYAISQVDSEKLRQLSIQFEALFTGQTSFFESEDPSAVPLPGSQQDLSPFMLENKLLQDIRKAIEEDIERSGYGDKIKVSLDKEGLAISIQDVMLFNSGDATVLESVTPLLLQISKNLDTVDNKIKVAGHTDNVPIHNAQFRSNWDLSAMRAINVMNFMVEEGGLNPERFTIQGFGEYSPVADNSTEEGRAKNRRVEIFLSRKHLPENDIDFSENEDN
ncbi:MAG: flagellar motor protein MotB [Desulfitobacteriia bacterium]|jgi:chemotaxis protein MotB